MEDIAQVFRKSSTIALSKTFYYVNDKMAFEIRSRVAFFFFPLLSSEKLWGSHSKNLICFSRCLFLTGNISHRCSDFPNLKGGGGFKLYTKLCQKTKTKQNKNKTKKYMYIGHRARSRAKDNRSSLPGPLIE